MSEDTPVAPHDGPEQEREAPDDTPTAPDPEES